MRIGFLIEGGIDEKILPPLMEQLMSVLPEHRRRRLDYYPVPFPPNGYIGNVNKHVFKVVPEPQLPKAPEKDPDPKKTLADELGIGYCAKSRSSRKNRTPLASTLPRRKRRTI